MDGPSWADIDEEEQFEPQQQQPGLKPQAATKTEEKRLPDGTIQRTRTELVEKEDGMYKVVTVSRVTRKNFKVFPVVEERAKRWVRFGKAVDNPPDITVVKEPVRLELGKKADLQEKKADREIQRIFTEAQKLGARMGDAAFLPDKKGDVELDLSKRKYEVKGQGVEMDSGKPQRDERCTVRVFNLSTDISEDDLTQKFNKCGRTTRVNIPRDKETGMSRRFAFVTFEREEYAERAIEKLNKTPMGHVIIGVERPRRLN